MRFLSKFADGYYLLTIKINRHFECLSLISRNTKPRRTRQKVLIADTARPTNALGILICKEFLEDAEGTICIRVLTLKTRLSMRCRNMKNPLHRWLKPVGANSRDKASKDVATGSIDSVSTRGHITNRSLSVVIPLRGNMDRAGRSFTLQKVDICKIILIGDQVEAQHISESLNTME